MWWTVILNPEYLYAICKTLVFRVESAEHRINHCSQTLLAVPILPACVAPRTTSAIDQDVSGWVIGKVLEELAQAGARIRLHLARIVAERRPVDNDEIGFEHPNFFIPVPPRSDRLLLTLNRQVGKNIANNVRIRAVLPNRLFVVYTVRIR